MQDAVNATYYNMALDYWAYKSDLPCLETRSELKSHVVRLSLDVSCDEMTGS